MGETTKRNSPIPAIKATVSTVSSLDGSGGTNHCTPKSNAIFTYKPTEICLNGSMACHWYYQCQFASLNNLPALAELLSSQWCLVYYAQPQLRYQSISVSSAETHNCNVKHWNSLSSVPLHIQLNHPSTQSVTPLSTREETNKWKGISAAELYSNTSQIHEISLWVLFKTRS